MSTGAMSKKGKTECHQHRYAIANKYRRKECTISHSKDASSLVRSVILFLRQQFALFLFGPVELITHAVIMQVACLPPLKWDDELAEVAQIWADQCAMIIYPGGRGFPRIFHEKSSQRTTSKFQHPPGVGQNVAWALTEGVNFTQIIDDLWYRDIR